MAGDVPDGTALYTTISHDFGYVTTSLLEVVGDEWNKTRIFVLSRGQIAVAEKACYCQRLN